MNSSADNSQEPSLVQFRLRTILLIVVPVAILCAVLMPIVRSWDPERQWRTLWYVLSFASGSLLMVTFLFSFRRRAENRRGTLRFIFPMIYNWSWRWAPWMMIGSSLVTIGAIAFTLGIEVRVTANTPPAIINSFQQTQKIMFWSHIVIFLSVGTALTQACLMLLWRRVTRSVEICEDGYVINAVRLSRWSSVKRFEIKDDGDVFRLESAWFSPEFEVPLERRQPLIDFLTAKGIRRFSQTPV
jgi:hypothetical protein